MSTNTKRAAGYCAVLFAPDGEWVTDHRRDTVEEVEEALADQGSRWYFYPYEAVARDHPIMRDTLRLVSVAYPLEEMGGRTIKTVSRYLQEHDELLP